MTRVSGPVAALLAATVLLGGCAAHHATPASDVLKLQTDSGSAAAPATLPADVWPGAAPAAASPATPPPAAEAAPLRPKYETDAGPAARQYRIDGANAVKRLPSDGKPATQGAPPPTYSIEPSR